mmetsp:Transcript_22696/g.17118  ORF Transcript_22696/g.17118 Transcript_22696/m.17118 type:complete len:97 (-) Transcript_22696:355-645(-)
MKEGKPTWDRVPCVDIVGMEVYGATPSVAVTQWNISVCNFAKNYIFKRQLSRNEKPSFFTMMSTWMFSALWHGFYLVNFELFIGVILMIQLERQGK